MDRYARNGRDVRQGRPMLTKSSAGGIYFQMQVFESLVKMLRR
jgi:hypothetical protein